MTQEQLGLLGQLVPRDLQVQLVKPVLQELLGQPVPRDLQVQPVKLVLLVPLGQPVLLGQLGQPVLLVSQDVLVLLGLRV